MVPAVIGTAFLMVNLNASSVTIALPTIARDLAIDPLRLNIVITSYLLALAIFLPFSGWLADRFGAKAILTTAIVLFAASSVACAYAGTLVQLVAGRLLQGCAGAMVAPVGRLILLRSTPRQELIAALSTLSMPALLGPLVGPLLGGLIVSALSWPWIFLLNLPVAATVLILVSLFVPDIVPQPVSPIDWRGIFLIGTAMGTAIIALDNIINGGLPPIIVVGLFAMASLCVVLYRLYADGREDAAVDIALFRIATFRIAVIGGAFFRLIPGAAPFLLTLLLQLSFGMSAFQAGTITFMSAVGSLAMKAIAPPIVRRFGFRHVLLANGFAASATFITQAFFTPATPQIAIALALILGGFFQALQFTTTWSLAFADVPPQQMSRASTTTAIVQQIVQSASTALAAALAYSFALVEAPTSPHVPGVMPAFAIIGGLSLLSLAYFRKLGPTSGMITTAK